MPIEFPAFTEYYITFLGLENTGPISKTPILIENWYKYICHSDLPKLKTLAADFPIPGFFEYSLTSCKCGCGVRHSIYSAIKCSKVTRELLEFLVEKAIPVEYRGTVAIDILYGTVLDYKNVKQVLPLITLFKPQDILSIPESLDYIMSIFPMYDLKVSRELLDILEGMFPDSNLYNKLCPSAQKHLAVPS
jgi:hypothetical protein